MNLDFNIGQCAVCGGQGLMLIVKNAATVGSVEGLRTDSLLIMCDECECMWPSPEDALSNTNAIRSDVIRKVIDPTYAEVRAAGWDKFLSVSMSETSEPNILFAIDARGVATIVLNRPEVRNAFDDTLIADLTKTLRQLESAPAVRAVVLTGAGECFSAGGDLNWMRRMAQYSEAENIADAMALADLLRLLNEFAKPTIARVNGAAYAGGLGLVCCCDVAIAAEEATFAISEVRLGLVPGTISPYVVAAIGARMARRYFLSGEPFPAVEAHRLGLVHAVVPCTALDEAVASVAAALLQGGPAAQARAKRLIAEVADRPVTEAVRALTARAIAEARASAEGREGLAAFFEKRKPTWRR